MHKKVHQNIIFSIQKVKRNRLDPNPVSEVSQQSQMVKEEASEQEQEQEQVNLNEHFIGTETD